MKIKYSIFGAGFIGKALLDLLLKNNCEVSVLDRNNCPIEYNGIVKWYKGELANQNLVYQAIEGSHTVYNFMSGMSNLSNNCTENLHYEVINNINFINACCKKSIKKVVFASSAAVYGVKPCYPITETAVTNPISIYGIKKLLLEKFYLKANHEYGLSVCIARIANPYGPGQKLDKGFISILTSNILNKKKMQVVGEKVVRDFYYIDNLASDLHKMSSLNDSLNIINCSTGIGYSLHDIIKLTENILNCKIQCQLLKKRSGDIPYSVLDRSYSNQVLGNREHVDIVNGLKKTLKSYGL